MKNNNKLYVFLLFYYILNKVAQTCKIYLLCKYSSPKKIQATKNSFFYKKNK